MSIAVFEKISLFLQEHNIPFQILEHEPTPTSEIAARVRGTSEEQGAKAMVLRSKGTFYMFVLPGNEKIDLAKAKGIIHQKRISFATPPEVLEVTDCEVGSVPPFGNLFNLQLFVDRSLLKNKEIAFNAGLTTKSMVLDTQAYIKATRAKAEQFCM